jgi:hypothetical protein
MSFRNRTLSAGRHGSGRRWRKIWNSGGSGRPFEARKPFTPRA